MSVTAWWALSFDSPALAVWNTLWLAVTVAALLVLVRGLLDGRGLMWRDLCLVVGIAWEGAAVPMFVLVWLLAEWVSADESEPPVLDGAPWVPESQT